MDEKGWQELSALATADNKSIKDELMSMIEAKYSHYLSKSMLSTK